MELWGISKEKCLGTCREYPATEMSAKYIRM